MLFNRLKRAFSLCLIVALLLCPLTSCAKKADPLAKSGFTSLTLDKKNRVNVEITLDSRDLQSHAGEAIFLYELLPGEKLSALSQKDPLDSAKVSSIVTLSTSLRDGERTRLYSRFYAAFSDGSLLSTDGFWIENPQQLAKDQAAFPWNTSPKGIANQDPNLAIELGSMHLMLTSSVSELTKDATESFTFNQVDHPISSIALEKLDKQAIDATQAGMQVSLTLKLDGGYSLEQSTALLDFLAERYSKNTNGHITALFLDTEEATDIADMAFLCRAANQAIRSRTANARVYAVSDYNTVTETKTFFSNLQLRLAPGGKISWGAAIRPVLSEQPWEKNTSDTMTLNRLDEVNESLSSNISKSPATWLAVCGLSFSGTSPDNQAVAYAYAYRQAIAATATLVYYDPANADAGFYTEEGNARRIVSIFSTIDAALSQDDQLLCQKTVGDYWNQKIADLDSRKQLSGIATLGSTGFSETPLYEFSANTSHGFTAISGTEPIVLNSLAWNAPVLSTWVDPNTTVSGGLRVRLTDTEALEGAASLSTWVLTAQAGEATRSTVRLTLEGQGKNRQRITYTADIEVTHGEWQLITFQIADFVIEADLSYPTYLSLTTKPNVTPDDDFVFYVKDIYVRVPQSGCGTLLPSLMIVACVVTSATVILAIYQKTRRKRA